MTGKSNNKITDTPQYDKVQQKSFIHSNSIIVCKILYKWKKDCAPIGKKENRYCKKLLACIFSL